MTEKNANVIANNNRRRIGIIIFFALLLGISILLNIINGTTTLEFQDIIDIIRGNGDELIIYQIIQNIRLPRVLTGMMVGMNLAIAGALLQGILRNPLAAPHIIGVNSGAAFMAVVVMVLLPHMINILPLAAFIGALGATMLVYSLTYFGKGNVTTNIILGGVAISALLSAFTSAIMLIYADELEVTYTWLLGSLSGRSWDYFFTVLPYSLAGIAMAVFLSPKVNLFNLGDEVSRSLGLEIKLYRAFIIITAAVLAGSAISVSGTIGFIGLIAPHLSRMLVGNDYRYLVILSSFIGAFLLITADLLSRTIFQPVELPVGLFTAALGAPFFFYLIYRNKNKAVPD
jgi:iron complex transport system permease protein